MAKLLACNEVPFTIGSTSFHDGNRNNFFRERNPIDVISFMYDIAARLSQSKTDIADPKIPNLNTWINNGVNATLIAAAATVILMHGLKTIETKKAWRNTMTNRGKKI